MSVVVMGAGIEMLIPGTKYRVAEDLEGNKYLRLDSVFDEQIYPLRPLPEKHGRIVDVGPFEVVVYNRKDHEGESFDDGVVFILEKMDALPTIVEAEGE